MRQDLFSRRAWLRAGAASAAMLALAACGQATATTDAGAATISSAALPVTAEQSSTSEVTAAPTTTASAPLAVLSTTTAPVTTANSVAAVTTRAVPAAALTNSATSSSAVTTAASAATAAKEAGVKLTLDAGGSQASYQVQEQLAGHSLPSAAIGRTNAVSGSILLDATGKIVSAQSSFTIDLRTLKSDQSMRDNYIQHDPLNTAQYPTAMFVPTGNTGMPWPLPDSGTAKFNMAGTFTVHGTTKPTTWAVTATFAPGKVTGTATTPFLFTDYGMQPPHTMVALSVENNGILTLQFSATQSAGA